MLSVLPQWDMILQSLSDWTRTTCCQINFVKRSRHDSLFMGERCSKCKKKIQCVHTSENCLIKGNLPLWILPWKSFHCWRLRNPEGTRDKNDDHSQSVKCLGIYTELRLFPCAQTANECVFLHSHRCGIISAWVASCSRLTPEGPVFISTFLQCLLPRKKMKQLAITASKPKVVTFSKK